MSVPFNDLLNAVHHGKPISVRCIVSGKTTSPYSVPKKLRFKCHDGDETCNTCTETPVINITSTDNLLRFVDVPDVKMSSVLRAMFGIKCKGFQFEVLEVQSIERIFISAPTGKERNRNVSNFICYYLGYGINVNTLYELDGVPTTDPTSQEATCVFTKATKLRSDIDTFALTRKMRSDLEDFEIKKPTPEKIYGYLESLYDTYARNITKIYNRFHLHMAVDMVFHSVLSFSFAKERVHKGWIDAIVVGDTRCGKGYVSEKLVGYFNTGEVVSGDNCSYAGLIGGIDQYGSHRVISWGKIPLNDGGMVVVDEAGEIKNAEWTRFSRVRSEGVAEVVKIQKQVTNARTRLLWLANPPLKTIAAYSYGIQSLVDIVKAPEDIARFDYALVVSHEEVSVEDINKPRKEVTPLHSPKDEQALIMWAWSRKPNQIQFSDEAVRLLYKKSVLLSHSYSFAVPLIQGENVRVKLAKMAVCFASRTYSNRENGEILYVDAVHVECAFVFFNMIYKLDASGYYAMSQLHRSVDVGASPKDLEFAGKYFNSFGQNKMKLCRCLINNNTITPSDIAEHMNLSREIVNEVLSKLLEFNLIRKRAQSSYEKTPAFTAWLKKMVLDAYHRGE